MSEPTVAYELMIVEPPGAPKFLVVRLIVKCDRCGLQGMQFLGHHVRDLRRLLEDIEKAQPELCDGGIEKPLQHGQEIGLLTTPEKIKKAQYN